MVAAVVGVGTAVVAAARHKTEELVRAFARSLPGDVLCHIDTHLDEPGPYLRPGSGRRELHRLLGVRRGPLLGATIAVRCAFVLRGRGGGQAGSAAAQGAPFTHAEHPDQN